MAFDFSRRIGILVAGALPVMGLTLLGFSAASRAQSAAPPRAAQVQKLEVVPEINLTPFVKDGSVAPEVCGRCHPLQYEQWKQSYHAKSHTTDTFLAMWRITVYNKGFKDAAYCIECHAPEVKIRKNAMAVGQALFEGKPIDNHGVTCVVCHSTVHSELDFDPEVRSIRLDTDRIKFHRTKIHSFQETAQFCATCHDYNAGGTKEGPPCCTVTRDWMKTDLPKQDITCQQCHMGARLGVNKNAEEPWNHTFPGQRFPDFVKRAVEMDVEAQVKQGKVVATVGILNKAGHTIPNG